MQREGGEEEDLQNLAALVMSDALKATPSAKRDYAIFEADISGAVLNTATTAVAALVSAV